ncbi:hypothetical protein [Baekduia sp. Peel2402]|uniref:hypothetical protein n=1 Tax=Baekduia sp. Peel2402 TaxID=3458296 RepID=UPI00403E8517
MSRIIRLGVLVTACLSFIAFATATANAVTWHNTGDTAYTATGAATTLSVTGANLTCPGSTFTGTTGAAPFVGAVWVAASGTGSFTGCSMAGQQATTSCAYKVTAFMWTAGSPAVMNGSADITCTTYILGTLNCVTQGSTPGTYTNPFGAVNGNGVAPTSSSLRITGSGCMLGNNDVATISTTPLRITSASGGPSSPHQGPIVTRTA